MTFPLEPAVSRGDLRAGGVSWEELDLALTALIGRPALAVPSVRVGMLWVLEYLGLQRNDDEILVPRYLGRCILEALGRTARPVQRLGSRTKAAIVVHSFGLRPNWEAVRPQLEARQIAFLEDAPDSLSSEEGPVPGSLGKFIALGKLLPLLKGGVFMTDKPDMAQVIRTRRRKTGSLLISAFVTAVLTKNRVAGHLDTSPWLEAAYALYPHCPADNAFVRGVFMRALSYLDWFSAVEARRLEVLHACLPDQVLLPDARRLIHCVPLVATGALISGVLSKHGFSPGQAPVDVKRNLFEPIFEEAFLLPIHPQIPEHRFQQLVKSLSGEITRNDDGTAICRSLAPRNPTN